CIVVPVDVQHADASDPSRAHGSVFSSAALSPPRVVPEEEELDRAAEILNAGGRVAMLIGQGALGAEVEVTTAAALRVAGGGEALIPRLKRKTGRKWREEIEEGVARWKRVLEERANLPGDPLNPMKVFQELSPLLPDGCLLTADSGTSANWWARHLTFREGMQA